MTPDVSRAVAAVKQRLELEDGPVLAELTAAAASARTVADLPGWAVNVLAMLGGSPDDQVIAEAASRFVDDDGLDSVTVTPPPGE